ncbi:MAG: hypothetical protein ACREQ9_18815 [Candidatus Binatia bacterium]
MEAPDVDELVIRGGTIFDGSGAPGRAADMAIAGCDPRDRAKLQGKRALDASGCAVAPGFIGSGGVVVRTRPSSSISIVSVRIGVRVM